jgi:ATP/ADP translocase
MRTFAIVQHRVAANWKTKETKKMFYFVKRTFLFCFVLFGGFSKMIRFLKKDRIRRKTKVLQF